MFNPSVENTFIDFGRDISLVRYPYAKMCSPQTD